MGLNYVLCLQTISRPTQIKTPALPKRPGIGNYPDNMSKVELLPGSLLRHERVREFSGFHPMYPGPPHSSPGVRAYPGVKPCRQHFFVGFDKNVIR